MICPMCNATNRNDAKFCKKCGHALHVETPAPVEVAVANQDVAAGVQSANAEEDISLAPTQIISPEQMLKLQERHWQREAEQDRPAEELTAAASDSNDANSASSAPDIADLPTMIIAPPAIEAASAEPSNEDTTEEDALIPPPPPLLDESPTPGSASQATRTESEADNASNGDAQEEETVAETADSTGATVKDAPEEVQMTTDDHETEQKPAPETDEFPTLAAGAVLIGRYEISELVSAEPDQHVYQVIDRQGYQRCWNCGSEQNREGDEFCIDCGAGLSDVAYLMHEYPATQEKSAEANVLHETIVNTFVDQGHTYVVAQEQAAENPFPNGVRLSVASDSDAGDIRRSDPNEDSTLILLLQRIHESNAAPVGLFVVADGMGGHDNGQRASHLAISALAERITHDLLLAPLSSENAGEAANTFDEDALVSLLHDAVEDANVAIYKENQRAKTDMGSTITGFMIFGDYAFIFNVGDSRTYMMRGGQIYRLTTDHSLVAQLVAGGLIQPDDVYTHPQRSQIFRSLGDKLNVQIDIFKQQLHPGDILLSCCDGLWEMVRDPQIESILTTAPDLQTACSQLIDAANQNGGEDNISTVIVSVH
ncbi:MAG: protein phosphatase 2C domain-containing protein [Ktedonobacteraceae bacterium]